MTYSVDWVSKVITIPETDLTLVSGTRYQLNLESFLYECRRLEWTFLDGLWAPNILEHSNVRFDFSGANYAAFDEIVNGYTVTIGAGPTRVDLVGSNNNIADVINNTNIILASANSAGLTNISEVRSMAFNGAVTIDTVSGVSGTVYPTGTRKPSSNNMTDASLILHENGLDQFNIASDLTIVDIDASHGHNFVGDSPLNVLTILPAADLSNCSINNLSVIGELDGLNSLTNCSLGAVTKASGFMHQCALDSTVSLSGETYLLSCYSQASAGGYPVISSGTHNIVMRDYKGDVAIADMTDGHHSIGLDEGKLIIESSCTGGEIHVRGTPFDIVDNSAGTTVICENEGLKVGAIHKANFHRRKHDDVANTITIYDTDNVTPLFVFDADDGLTDITPQ